MGKVEKGNIYYRGTKYGVFKVQAMIQLPSSNVLVKDIAVPMKMPGPEGFVVKNRVAYTVDGDSLMDEYAPACRIAKYKNSMTIADNIAKIKDLEYELKLLKAVIIPLKEPVQE